MEERYKVEQFRVREVIIPALNRNSVVELETKGLETVINDTDTLCGASQDSEILEIVLVDTYARVTEDAVRNVLVSRIQDIQQGVCVNFLRGCEDDDFEPL